MKKLLSVFIAVIMILTLVPTAFADDNTPPPPTDTPQVTETPQSTETPQPTLEPTATPQFTDTPQVTPETTVTPEPTETPQPTLEPTASPEPTGTAQAAGTVQATDDTDPGVWTPYSKPYSGTDTIAYDSMYVTNDGTPYYAYQINTSTKKTIYFEKYDGTQWVSVGNNSGYTVTNLNDMGNLNVAPDGTIYLSVTTKSGSKVYGSLYKLGSSGLESFVPNQYTGEIKFTSDSRPYFMIDNTMYYYDNNTFHTASIDSSETVSNLIIDKNDVPYVFTTKYTSAACVTKRATVYKFESGAFSKITNDVFYYGTSTLDCTTFQISEDGGIYMAIDYENSSGGYIYKLDSGTWNKVIAMPGNGRIFYNCTNCFKIDSDSNFYICGWYSGSNCIFKSNGTAWLAGNGSPSSLYYAKLYMPSSNKFMVVLKDTTFSLYSFEYKPKAPVVTGESFSIRDYSGDVNSMYLGQILQINCGVITNDFTTIKASIINSSGQTVAALEADNCLQGTKLYWDGKATKENTAGLDEGVYVPASTGNAGVNYTVEISAVNSAGNAEKNKTFAVMTMLPSINVSSHASKYYTGMNNDCLINASFNSYLDCNFELFVYDSDNKMVADEKSSPNSTWLYMYYHDYGYCWDLKATDGNGVAEGPVPSSAEGVAYTYKLEVTNASGTTTAGPYDLSVIDPVRATGVTITDKTGASCDTATIEQYDSLQLGVAILPDNATFKTVTWSSSAYSYVAYVDQTGKVTANEIGTSTITATADGQTDTCLITVVKKPVDSVGLSKESVSMVDYDTYTLTSTLTPSYPSYPTVTWTSSDESVATVSGNGGNNVDGIVTATGAGTATITATADGVSNTCEVTVTPKFYTITTGPNNESYGSVTGGGTFEEKKYTTVTATPKDGYKFSRWTNGGVFVSDKAAYTFIPDKDCTLTAEFSDLNTPVILNASQASYKSLIVTWDKVGGVNGYRLYRSTSEDGKYTLLKTTSSLSYTDTKLTTFKAYYYKVCTYTSSGRNIVEGNYSYPVKANTVLGKMSGVKAKTYYPGKIKVSWNAVSGAAGYEVYYSVGYWQDDADYEFAAETKNTYSNITGLCIADDYHYIVHAYSLVGGVRVYNDWSDQVDDTPCIQPAVVKATTDVTTIRLSWNKVVGAQYYEIYYDADGESKDLGYTLKNSVTFNGLVPNVTYKFEVHSCYYNSDENECESEADVEATPTFGTVTGLNVIMYSSSKNKLTWNSLHGAIGYNILRSESSDSGFERIGSTKVASYIDSTIEDGETYYYKIEGYCAVYGGTYESDPCDPVQAVPAQVTGLKAVKQSSTQINLTWSKVPVVTSYEVWRSTSPDSGFVKIGESSSASYSDTGVTAGTKYYYKVVAYKTVGSDNIYGAYSVVKSLKI